MLASVVEFSLRNRFVVLTLAVVLFGFGIYTAANSPMDVFPEFAPPQVTVETEAPGLTEAFGYSKWKSGKEYKTELIAADGLTVMRRLTQTWEQRAPQNDQRTVRNDHSDLQQALL